MLTHQIDDLLSLFALMIFADKRVHENEVSAFVRLVDKLNVARLIEPRLSEAKLSIWYEKNKSNLQSVMESSDFEPWLYETLDRLKKIPDKLPIMGVMCDIATSDGEVHVSEKALVELTARRWDIAV